MDSTPPIATGSRNERWHSMAYWAVLAVACVTFWVMNSLTTLKEDDLSYTLIDGVWTPVRSFGDLLQSLRNHYLSTNGRMADVVAIIFAAVLGKTAFNIANTVVFGILCHLLCLLAAGRRSLLTLLGFLVVVGTCYPVPGETMLWMSGSCNYLWAITASLFLAWFLLRGGTGSKTGWAGSVVLLLGAIVAGSFNEATTIGFFIGFAAYYACNRQRLDRVAAMAMLGYLAGLMLILLSPGLWQRAADGGLVYDLGWPNLLSTRCNIFAEKMLRFVTPLVALAGCALALLHPQGRRAVRRCPWCFVLVALALTMFLLGLIQERAYAPLATVAFLLVMTVVERLLCRCRWLWLTAVCLGLVLATFTWARGIGVLKDYKAFDDATVTEIVAASRQAILHERQFQQYSRFVKPMNYKSTSFFAHEVIYCAYFDKDNVQFVSDTVYDRYHSGRLLEGALRLPLESAGPQVVDSVLAVPGLDYMAVFLHADTIPMTFQTARYHYAAATAAMSERERACRTRYGLVTDINPQGFFPLRYNGNVLLILPVADRTMSYIDIPLGLGNHAPGVRLTWK